jgi:hypothetical protein
MQHAWSRSIGTGGRDRSEWLVAIVGMRTHDPVGAVLSVQYTDGAVERRLCGRVPILNIQLFAIEVEGEQAGR